MSDRERDRQTERMDDEIKRYVLISTYYNNLSIYLSIYLSYDITYAYRYIYIHNHMHICTILEVPVI